MRAQDELIARKRGSGQKKGETTGLKQGTKTGVHVILPGERRKKRNLISNFKGKRESIGWKMEGCLEGETRGGERIRTAKF